MASSSLIVPLAFWVNLPTAPVTTVAYKEGHIVTGLKDGHIWIYRCIINGQGTPQVNFKSTLRYYFLIFLYDDTPLFLDFNIHYYFIYNTFVIVFSLFQDYFYLKFRFFYNVCKN
jgi:hypothetical protein